MTQEKKYVQATDLFGKPHHVSRRGRAAIRKNAAKGLESSAIGPHGDLANKYRDQAQHDPRQFLQYARRCGQELLKLKERVRTAYAFRKWLKQAWKGTAAEARLYMRLKEQWKHPRLIEARESDTPPQDIKDLKAVLRNMPLARVNKKHSQKRS